MKYCYENKIEKESHRNEMVKNGYKDSEIQKKTLKNLIKEEPEQAYHGEYIKEEIIKFV